MLIVHLTASTFFGGPERQMLGLAEALPPPYRCRFLSFPEGGRCQAFVSEARRRGFEADALTTDTPRLDLAWRELVRRLSGFGARILCCHGYKAGLVGRLAARRVGIPVVAVSRGWTGESLKVRLYERLDRLGLRWMDRVVCVSRGQAAKVRRAGVPPAKVVVIPNAVQAARFGQADPSCREELRLLFPLPPGRIVAAVGRLSPEKGFDVLIRAAGRVVREMPAVGFVLFGDGPLRPALAGQIERAGLGARFVLAGFRNDLDRFYPHFDVLAQSSYTEGMPNVVLEALAAGVPVVATAVGGTAEVAEEGVSGRLVPPGDAAALARRLLEVLRCPATRRAMARAARERVLRHFTFEAQSAGYRRLFDTLPRPDGRAAISAPQGHQVSQR
jgi:glycosyltransferase involved in cell wall biosynthesis